MRKTLSRLWMQALPMVLGMASCTTDGTRYIQPATAAEYCDRTWDFPYKIDHDDLCFRLFTTAGFEWGGDWTSCKDFQHFEIIE